MSILNYILHIIRPNKDEYEQDLVNLVNNTYKSTRVVGRGTVRTDPNEVSSTESFQEAKKKAKQIVDKAGEQE